MSLDREPGFIYRFRHLRPSKSGRLVLLDEEEVHNLMPYEGLNHMLATEFSGGAQLSAWYVALFSGDYTPTRAITASDFATTATECTVYTPTTRPVWTPSTPAYGQMDNSSSLATFTFTGTASIYGAALISSSSKGGTTGVLASIVRASAVKAVAESDVLTVSITQGFVIS